MVTWLFKLSQMEYLQFKLLHKILDHNISKNNFNTLKNGVTNIGVINKIKYMFLIFTKREN